MFAAFSKAYYGVRVLRDRYPTSREAPLSHREPTQAADASTFRRHLYNTDPRHQLIPKSHILA
jgi:hypothetical protein